jgi:S-adenosylmethionine decarboxylase
MPSDSNLVLEQELQTVDNSAPEEATTEYEFGGRHLFASYVDCDPESLRSPVELDQAMRRAIEASGATVLKESRHIFEGGGLTNVYLLSESHASIHTYPEHNSCFVDIFTCGYVCEPTRFHEVLVEFFKPKTVSKRLTNRGLMNVDLTE